MQEHGDDCVSACVASLLGLPLSAVPRFQPESWGDELDHWLERRGYGFVNLFFTGEQQGGVPRGYPSGAGAPSTTTVGLPPEVSPVRSEPYTVGVRDTDTHAMTTATDGVTAEHSTDQTDVLYAEGESEARR